MTDANVMLGILDPDFFLGGRIKLNRRLAEQAVDRIAQYLGVRREEAAHAITTTSNHNMVAAIEEITCGRESTHATVCSFAAAEAPPATSRRWPTYLV